MSNLTINKLRQTVLLCLLAVFAASCGSDDDDGDGGSFPILLSAELPGNDGLRAVITAGQSLPSDLNVGVYISENDDANTDIGRNIYYQTNASGGLVLQAGQTQPYYPASGRGVKINAYYPHNSGDADSYAFAVNTDQSTDGNYNASDLLYSSGTYPRSNSVLTLPFGHKMGRITYHLVKGADMTDTEISNATVTVLNAETAVTFDRTTGVMIAQTGQRSDITPHSSKAAIVAPQAFSEGTSVLKISTGGSDYYAKAPAGGWTIASGESLDLTVTVSKTGISLKYTLNDWTNGTVNDNGGNVTAYSYQVGDYYPNPKDASTAIGVVFWINPADSRHGKVVGLQETQGRWGPMKDENAAGVVGIRRADNGKQGTRNLIDKYKEDANFATNYPIFHWIYQDMNKGNIDGVWYMPAIDELTALYNAKSAVNAALPDASGDLLSNTLHWSLTEQSGGFAAESLNIENGTGGGFTKNQNSKSRCILAY